MSLLFSKKAFWRGVIVFSLFASVHFAYAKFTPSDFRYERSISAPSKGDFVKVALPPDISRTSRALDDVRIIDQNGAESPYLITRSLTSKGGAVFARIINQTSSNGRSQFVVDAGNAGVVRAKLLLDTKSQNFKRQVSIYSANTLLPIDSDAWAFITNKGYIFKFTDSVTGFSSGKNDIDFGPSTARYYKVIIGEGSEGAVSVSGATLLGDTSVDMPSYTKEVSVTTYNNSNKRTTEATADLGSVGYLTNAITLRASGRNYSRRVIIESSNDDASWSYVAQGYISNVNTDLFDGSSDRVEYPEQNSRYIRASIVNDDNRPLSIVSDAVISGPVVSAIFENRQGSSYTLYYGNPNASRPVYDIANIASYIEENKIPIASLGGESFNPSYVAPAGPVIPFTEAHKWLLNALLLLVVAIFGVAIAWHLRNFSKGKKSGDRF